MEQEQVILHFRGIDTVSFLYVSNVMKLDTGLRDVEAPTFPRQWAHSSEVITLCPRKIPGTHFCYRLS
jgi:hypothetical protein